MFHDGGDDGVAGHVDEVGLGGVDVEVTDGNLLLRLQLIHLLIRLLPLQIQPMDLFDFLAIPTPARTTNFLIFILVKNHRLRYVGVGSLNSLG